jgi:ABC-type Fe3+-hydroxamate transport system substrate-binding protein
MPHPARPGAPPALAASLAVALLAVAPPGRADEAVSGADAARTYRVVTDGSSRTLKVGAPGRVVVAIEPTVKGVHTNREFPLRYKVEASPGLKVEKGELRRADAVDPNADNPRFEIPVTGAAPGAQQVTVQMRFAICSDTWCVPQARTVSVPIDVR